MRASGTAPRSACAPWGNAWGSASQANRAPTLTIVSTLRQSATTHSPSRRSELDSSSGIGPRPARARASGDCAIGAPESVWTLATRLLQISSLAESGVRLREKPCLPRRTLVIVWLLVRVVYGTFGHRGQESNLIER